MTERLKRDGGNPYQAPSSELVDQFKGEGEWSDFTIRRAKEFARCVFLGYSIAISIYIFATIALDVILLVWSEVSFSAAYTKHLILLLAIITAPACANPYSWLYVRYQRRKRSFVKFLESRQKQLDRPYSRPFPVSVFILLASLLLLIYREAILDVRDLELTWLTERGWALIALPLAMPIVYFVIRDTHRRAKVLLERMLSSG
ncbi:MAG: hypothetical protein OXG24_05980 [Gammaproteobacteria bacterium]|nr:hypothetical protein [Gammaproteobacteria bacterium]